MDLNLSDLSGKLKDATQRPAGINGNTPTGAEATWAVHRDSRLERIPLVMTRRHRFADPISLCTWLTRFSDPATAEIFVGETMVEAITHGRDIESDAVAADLELHPVWERWALLDGKPLDQNKLHAHLRAAVVDTKPMAERDDDSKMSAGESLLAQMGKISAKTGTSYAQEIDARGTTTLRAADATTTVEGKIPAEFTIWVPMFIGVTVGGVEPLYGVRVLVTVEVNAQGRPVFRLDYPDLPITQLAARKDVERCLHEALGAGWVIGLGKTDRVAVAQQEKLQPARLIYAFASVSEQPDQSSEAAATPAVP